MLLSFQHTYLSLYLYEPIYHNKNYSYYILLTHWDRVTHISVSNLSIVGIWTIAGIVNLTLVNNIGRILMEPNTFVIKKMHLKNFGLQSYVYLVSASMS